MIGFITTSEVSAAITQAIQQAQTSRGLPVYWILVGVEIVSGPHVGNHFLPADDMILAAPLRGYPIQTPSDFPEFAYLVEMLGGLSARVEIAPSEILVSGS